MWRIVMKYSIGIDFGTLSGRALLVEVETGREIASAVKDYAHGVIDEYADGRISSRLGAAASLTTLRF